MPVAEALAKEVDRSAALEQHGMAALREIMLAAIPAPGVKQQAAIVLARHDEPLLARGSRSGSSGSSRTIASPPSLRYGP